MGIFISYRRNDSADVTGRIYDRLIGSFAKDVIFKDVDSIPFGVNFKTYLNDIVEKSEILLVVIGPKWLNITNELGKRRLDDPSDYVHIEVEIALRRKITIVPLLVSGASMPNASELPSSLEELAFYNGIQIRPDPDFHKDMNRLIYELGEHIKPVQREGISNDYSRANTPEKPATGSVSDRSPIEDAKVAIANFSKYLPTPFGRFLLAAVLGGMTSFFINPELVSIIELSLIFGVLGLILYPHKMTLYYIGFGTLLLPLIDLLVPNSLEFMPQNWLNYIFGMLFSGALFGAIFSRIQHNRKKI